MCFRIKAYSGNSWKCKQTAGISKPIPHQLQIGIIYVLSGNEDKCTHYWSCGCERVPWAHESGRMVGCKWDNRTKTFPWRGLSNGKPMPNCLGTFYRILGKPKAYFRQIREQPCVSEKQYFHLVRKRVKMHRRKKIGIRLAHTFKRSSEENDL